MAALVAATGNAARALNIESQVGRFELGKSADLFVLARNNDSLSDISVLQQREAVERVILKGKTVIKR